MAMINSGDEPLKVKEIYKFIEWVLLVFCALYLQLYITSYITVVLLYLGYYRIRENNREWKLSRFEWKIAIRGKTFTVAVL